MVSKQYSIRTQDYTTSHIEEAVLDDADPIHEIKALAGLTNVGNLGKLQEYKSPESPKWPIKVAIPASLQWKRYNTKTTTTFNQARQSGSVFGLAYHT
jgi:hypothetical protein